MSEQALVIGAGGGIGRAVVEHWAGLGFDRVWAVAREPMAFASDAISVLETDHSDESLQAVIAAVLADAPEISRVAICLGTLHGDGYGPEKSLEALDRNAMAAVYHVNSVLPLLWVGALARHLRKARDCRIAVLSARVGSIGDNGLGGWYSYRASKAALNMGLKCAAIELGRRARGVKLVAFHPGTVDTDLSAPFQRGVPEGKLFTPAFVAERLTAVLDNHGPDGELAYRDWDDKPIPW